MPKDTQTQVPDLIPTKDAAAMLGLHVSTVVRRVQAGEIPYAVKIPGDTGAYLFDRKVIEKLAKAA
jgi:excisionase family DNA binding protein